MMARVGWRSQLGGEAPEAEDDELALIREGAVGYEGAMALGQALSERFRYREAAMAYGEALAARPGDAAALRLRAGRLLSTLQCAEARADFGTCLERGGEPVDLLYRLGLSAYYLGEYGEALSRWEACFPLCDDEMGVAALFWHCVCSYRMGLPPSLACRYREGMKVGHHTAYEAALRLCLNGAASPLEPTVMALGASLDDLDFSIVAYGVARFLEYRGEPAAGGRLIDALLGRDAFWPGYAFLAAWNDRHRPR